jgi:allophanate hydrolase subunit 1
VAGGRGRLARSLGAGARRDGGSGDQRHRSGSVDRGRALQPRAAPRDRPRARHGCAGRPPERRGAPLTIDVVYDGPDIAALAYAARVSVDDVVRLHATGTYEVAFCGFSPGFAYLRGIDERLHVPRRDSPRTSVPAGSIGVAAGYTCVYPSASPGGWHLIGRTSAPLWDVDRDPPALLHPGRSVRFRRVPA